MEKPELEQFISNTLNQIKSSLPEGFRIDDKVNFNVSVVTTSKINGGIDIKLANIGTNIESQIIHKVQFSIVDEVAQEKSMLQSKKMLGSILTDLAKLDTNKIIEHKPKINNVKKK